MFVSSHLLSEIEHTCDSVAIIDRGKLVLEGGWTTCSPRPPRRRCSSGSPISTAGARVLQAAGLDVEPAGALLRVRVPPSEAAGVTKLLADAGSTSPSCGPTRSRSRSCSSR